MDSDDIKFDVIKECLKRIISNTLFIGTIDLILLLGLSQKQEAIAIAQFHFPIKYIALITLIALLYFTISGIHKFDRVLTLYKTIKNQEKKQLVKEYLNLYPTILNPFAEHESVNSAIFDHFALGIQSLFYLIGFSLSIRYLLPNSKSLVVVFIVTAIFLTLLRRDLILLEKEIDTIVTKRNKTIKTIFTFIFIGLYLVAAAIIK
jgi:hypothetical protein